MMVDFKPQDYKESVRNILKEYGIAYDKNAALLVAEILKRIEKGESVYDATTTALTETSFFSANKQAITDAMYLSACAGYGILPTIVTPAAQKQIKNKLLSDSWTGDKMPLSTRLHGASRIMRTNIVDTITASMLASESVKQTALKLYDGYNSGQAVINRAELPQYLKKLRDEALVAASGDKRMTKLLEEAISSAEYNIKKLNSKELKASYQAIVDAAKEFQAKAINKAARTAVEEKTRYHAERIARTESARAWFDGFIAENQDNDDDVWGYRWVLSSRHSRVPFDQCDVCANANVGFGKGVYPKNKVPSIPRHPHCMCMLEVVYEWEIDKTTKFNPNGAREYIDTLDDNHKAMLFGVEGAKAYQDGKDWQKLLRGWGGFEEPVSRLNGLFLNDAEKHAILKYISSESYTLNEKIRNSSKLSKADQQLADNLDAALGKLPKYQGAVYRSVSLMGIEDIQNFIASHKVGTYKNFIAYTSTSAMVYDETMPIQYVINSKRGVDLRDYNQNESEILFPRNSWFKIVKIEGNTIYMED